MDAAACVEVGEGTGYVCCERNTETPREGFGGIVDVGTDVAVFDEL